MGIRAWAIATLVAASAMVSSGVSWAADIHKHVKLNIGVIGDCFGMPGVVRKPQLVPLEIRVRSKAGKVLAQGNTDTEGRVELSVDWADPDEPDQIEAVVLAPDGGVSVGSIVGYRSAQPSYCLLIPGGTGPSCP